MTMFTVAPNGEMKTIALPGLGPRNDYALVSIDLAFRYVPWFRRACKARANDTARFPLALELDGEDVGELDEWQGVMRWTRRLLYQQAINVIKYGAAYHLIESNPANTKFEPRFIPTQAVLVKSDNINGVTGFAVNGIGDVPLRRMLYLWEHNDLSEIEPGTSDGEAALKAAGLLYAIEEMVNRYMNSGGVPVTAVKVPPTTSKDDREVLKNWLERMAGGFRKAFSFLAVNKDTEFMQIGSALKDTVSVELTDQQRDNVAVALGVPPSMLAGKSTDESNSRAEKMQYYAGTVIPFIEMLEPLLNERLYSRIGVRLRFRPEMLDVMQEAQVAQATAIKDLTAGKQIISVRTAIEWMGLDAEDELERLEEESKAAQERAAQMAPPPNDAPGQEVDATPEEAPETTDEERLKAWRGAALAAVRSGAAPAVGTPFDAELQGASSAGMVRDIFNNHWPRPHAPADSWHLDAVRELARYNDLVAAGSVSNG